MEDNILSEKRMIENISLVPFFVQHAKEGFLKGYAGVDVYNSILCYFKEDVAYWMTSEKDQHDGYVKVMERDAEYWERIVKDWKKKLFLALNDFIKEKDEDWSKLNNYALYDRFMQIHNKISDEIIFPGMIDGFIIHAAFRLNDLVKDFCLKNGIRNSNLIYEMLSAQIMPSFFRELEDDILRIKGNDNYIVHTSKNVRNHLDKYFWVNGSYIFSEHYTYEQFAHHAYSMGESSIDFDKVKADKKNLIRKYKFTPEIIKLARITELFGDWQDNRKVLTLIHSYFAQKMIDEVKKRTELPLELLKYSTVDEMELIIEARFDKNILSGRRAGCLFVYGKKEDEILTGHEAYDIYKKISENKIDDQDEVKGLTASKGYAKGHVKIVITQEDSFKVNKGDIIITPMTRPDHIVAMRKAAAIVTDDGGITCHAAIVSRELGIPCIIATKHATKVFSEGDMVEVDANNGIVRRIR